VHEVEAISTRETPHRAVVPQEKEADDVVHGVARVGQISRPIAVRTDARMNSIGRIGCVQKH